MPRQAKKSRCNDISRLRRGKTLGLKTRATAAVFVARLFRGGGSFSRENRALEDREFYVQEFFGIRSKIGNEQPCISG